MRNNVIFRQLRYIFNYKDDQMVALFALAEAKVTRDQVGNWLRKADHEHYQEISDAELATFLNGLINKKRGKREGPQPPPEQELNNNIIFRKLKIALNLKDTDIVKIFDTVDMEVSKHEISAFFRKPNQRQYRECQDQFLRNFLYGLQVKYRPKQ